MCKMGCKCDKCNSNSGNSAGVAAQLSEMQDTLTSLSNALKPFQCGHPILLIQNEDDINSFDFSTGLGQGCWEDWAICDGQAHYSANNKKNISTPNFIDKFIIMGGGAYPIDATGGNTILNLTVPQLPSHNHTITDPGHTHVVTDPGHTHEIVDPGHDHSFSGSAHTHGFTTDIAGNHNHQTDSVTVQINSGDGQSVRGNGTSGTSTSDNGLHVHSGTTNAASAGGSVGSAFTGIQDDPAFTGITNQTNATGITLGNTGTGDDIDITNPYYSAVYVFKYN